MPSVSKVAKTRLENLKSTGGIPATKPAMSQSAKNIKVRIETEKVPEGNVRRGKGY